MREKKLGNLAGKLGIITGSLFGTMMSFLVIIAFVWWLIPMSFVQVEAGFSGVAVDKPYMFGKSGVRKETLEPGRHLEWNSTKVIQVPSTPMRQPTVIDDFVTIDNYRVDFKTNVTFVITDPADVIKNWTLEFWSINIAAEYASFVREEVRKYKLQDLMSDHTTLNAIDQAITEKLNALIIVKKIPIRITTVAMGQATPNTIIFNQIEETARTVEQTKTYVERAKSEAERKESEKQRALADKAYQDNLGLTKEEYIRITLQKMQAEACQKATSCYIGIDKVVNTK